MDNLPALQYYFGSKDPLLPDKSSCPFTAEYALPDKLPTTNYRTTVSLRIKFSMSFIAGIVLVCLVTVTALFWQDIKHFFYKGHKHVD